MIYLNVCGPLDLENALISGSHFKSHHLDQTFPMVQWLCRGCCVLLHNFCEVFLCGSLLPDCAGSAQLKHNTLKTHLKPADFTDREMPSRLVSDNQITLF